MSTQNGSISVNETYLSEREYCLEVNEVPESVDFNDSEELSWPLMICDDQSDDHEPDLSIDLSKIYPQICLIGKPPSQ